MSHLLRVVNLLQNEHPIFFSETSQPVPASASRAHEMQPEVINVRLSLVGHQFSVAADANPHGASIYPRAALRACGGA